MICTIAISDIKICSKNIYNKNILGYNLPYLLNWIAVKMENRLICAPYKVDPQKIRNKTQTAIFLSPKAYQ